MDVAQREDPGQNGFPSADAELKLLAPPVAGIRCAHLLAQPARPAGFVARRRATRDRFPGVLVWPM